MGPLLPPALRHTAHARVDVAGEAHQHDNAYSPRPRRPRAQPRGTRRLLTVRFASNNAVADAEVLAGLNDPVILDVRDPAEVEAGKGGPPASVAGALHVPLNIDGQRQSERPTTQEEFLAAVAAAGLALPRDRPVVTHCGSGGRGGKAAGLLRDAGYDL